MFSGYRKEKKKKTKKKTKNKKNKKNKKEKNKKEKNNQFSQQLVEQFFLFRRLVAQDNEVRERKQNC